MVDGAAQGVEANPQAEELPEYDADSLLGCQLRELMVRGWEPYFRVGNSSIAEEEERRCAAIQAGPSSDFGHVRQIMPLADDSIYRLPSALPQAIARAVDRLDEAGLFG